MAPFALALILAASTSWGPPLPARRLTVVARTPEVARAAAAIIAHRISLGDQFVSPADIQAHLKAELEANPAWNDLVALMQKGTQAEQNLDLDAAVGSLQEARAGMDKVGAVWLERETYVGLLEQLARARFEQGATDQALEALRAWAQVRSLELDERSFPPQFIALARQARAAVQPLVETLPLEAFWSSGMVDWVLEVAPAGPAGGASGFLMLYYKPSSPKPVAVSPVVEGSTPEQSLHLLELATDSLFSGPIPASVASAAAAPPPVRNPNDVNAPISLFAGMAWPYWDNYSKYGVSSTGIGMDLGARFGFRGVELGGELELLGGQFAVYQFTPLVRWTWTKGRFAFSVEPALYLQIRQGNTNPIGLQQEQNVPSQTDVLFGVQGSAGIGLHLSDQWVLAEQVSVGAILAGNFDLNSPTGFHTTISYTF